MYLLIYLTHFQEPLRKKRCPPFSCRMTSGLPSAVRETEFHLEQEQPTGHKLNYLETPLYIKKFRTINSEPFKDTYIYTCTCSSFVLCQISFQIFRYMQITVKPQNERVLYLHTLPLINKQTCYHDPFDSINWKGMMTEIVPLPIL